MTGSDNGCRDCQNATSGYCSRHFPTRATASWRMGRWQFNEFPVCIACGRPSEYEVTLPYDSRYDGDHLCANCIKELIDPLIDKKIAERGIKL